MGGLGLAATFSEKEVHEDLHQQDLESLVKDAARYDEARVAEPATGVGSADANEGGSTCEEVHFRSEPASRASDCF